MSIAPITSEHLTSNTERRLHGRFKLERVYGNFGTERAAAITDWGGGGAGFEIFGPAKKGEIISLAFVPPGMAPVEATARVVWADEFGKGGLEFLDRTEAAKYNVQTVASNIRLGAWGDAAATSAESGELQGDTTRPSAQDPLPEIQRLMRQQMEAGDRNRRAPAAGLVAGLLAFLAVAICVVALVSPAGRALIGAQVDRVFSFFRGPAPLPVENVSVEVEPTPVIKKETSKLPRRVVPIPVNAVAALVEIADEPAEASLVSVQGDAEPARLLVGVSPTSAVQPPLAQGIERATLIAGVRPPGALHSLGTAQHALAIANTREATSPVESGEEQRSFEPAVLTERVVPIYPVFAKQQGLEGTVVVLATIGKDGVPRAIRRVSGPAALMEAALAAVAGWRYRPASRGGEPVEVQRIITLNFRLAP
jgi:TonB family protein